MAELTLSGCSILVNLCRCSVHVQAQTIFVGPVADMSREIPYEELNALQVSSATIAHTTIVYQSYTELPRRTWNIDGLQRLLSNTPKCRSRAETSLQTGGAHRGET